MDKTRPIKALGAGAVAVFLVAGVAFGADAILNVPRSAPVILTTRRARSPGADDDHLRADGDDPTRDDHQPGDDRHAETTDHRRDDGSDRDRRGR